MRGKVSGIKRHVSVYTNELPHVLCVTTANITDRVGAVLIFTAAKGNLSFVTNVLFDGWYGGESLAPYWGKGGSNKA